MDDRRRGKTPLKKPRRRDPRWWENHPGITPKVLEFLIRSSAFEYQAKRERAKSRIDALPDYCGKPVVLKMEWRNQGQLTSLREEELEALSVHFHTDYRWDVEDHCRVWRAFYREKKPRFLWLLLDPGHRAGPAWVFSRDKRLHTVIEDEERGWEGGWHVASLIHTPAVPLVCEEKDTLRTIIRESLTEAIVRLEQKKEIPPEIRRENPFYADKVGELSELTVQSVEDDEKVVNQILNKYLSTVKSPKILPAESA